MPSSTPQINSPSPRLRRVSQMAPPPPAAGGGAPPAPPMPPIPGMAPPPGGAPGAAPMAAPVGPPPSGTDRQEIAGPLDSLGKILYDFNIEDEIDGNIATGADDTAMKVWQAYGGTPMGGVDRSKVGTRDKNTEKQKSQEYAANPDAQQNDQDATDDCKWKRLPRGKTIGDICQYDDIAKIMDSLILNSVKNTTKAAGGGAAGGGPGGAPPGGPTASAKLWTMQRLARVLDRSRDSRLADILDDIVMRNLSARDK